MMQSATTRLNRAERDLAGAEANAERVRRYEPSAYTSRDEINAMRQAADDRVRKLRARVNVRRQATQREAA